MQTEGTYWIPLFDEPSPTRVVDRLEDERREAGLLAYAHREAQRWGAERFAAEFRRRDEEERRLRENEARALRAAYEDDAEPAPGPSEALSWGLVDSSASERVVGPDRSVLDLRPPVRHPFVVRAPAPDHEPDPGPGRLRRRRRRRRRDRITPEPVPAITVEQAARMSSAARRLYGLEDPPKRRNP